MSKPYRLIVIITLLLFSTGLSFGQSKARLGFTLSPDFAFSSIDYNASVIDGYSYKKDGSKFGIQYGVLADFDLSEEERYYFQTGLVMHHSGAKHIVNGGIVGGTESQNVNIQYLEIPLALKLKSNEIGYVRYYGQFGVNAGIKVGDNVKEPDDPNVELDYKTFNLGLGVGGGLEYAISDQTALNAGLVYINGFSNIADAPDLEKYKLSNLVIRLGVFF